MHESVLAFLRENVTEEMVASKRVLEVGSRDINGSARDVIEPLKPLEYVGVDMEPGPGVDIVCDFSKTVFFQPEFDLVICTEVMEHVESWRPFVENLKKVCGPETVLILTTRSPGFPLHEYPGDHWRYAPHHIEAIFADMNILKLERDPQVPGVFMIAKGFNGNECDLSKIDVARAPQG